MTTPIRKTYPGTSAREVLELAEGSAFAALLRAIRAETVNAIVALDCASEPERVLDGVRRLQVLDQLAAEVELAGAAAKKEIQR